MGKALFIAGFLLVFSLHSFAQGGATAGARLDPNKIMVGDQARLFIEVKNNPSAGRLQWAAIADTFNSLEVVEKGKIDTVQQGGMVTYKQRLILTGFDSGVFKIPAIVFTVIPNSGAPYMVQTDSFQLLVQTVAVDTTKAFKDIKGIIDVKGNWMDYIWYIVGGAVFVILIIFVVLYFAKNKKVPPPVPEGPVETLQEHTLKLLAELDGRQLWQKKKVKEYYVELTDIVKNYVEARFSTAALELTTDELLYKVQLHRELQPYYPILADILHTADLAKFAKAEPLPTEHTAAMDKAIKLVETSKPEIIVTPIEKAS